MLDGLSSSQWAKQNWHFQQCSGNSVGLFAYVIPRRQAQEFCNSNSSEPGGALIATNGARAYRSRFVSKELGAQIALRPNFSARVYSIIISRAGGRQPVAEGAAGLSQAVLHLCARENNLTTAVNSSRSPKNLTQPDVMSLLRASPLPRLHLPFGQNLAPLLGGRIPGSGGGGGQVTLVTAASADNNLPPPPWNLQASNQTYRENQTTTRLKIRVCCFGLFFF